MAKFSAFWAPSETRVLPKNSIKVERETKLLKRLALLFFIELSTRKWFTFEPAEGEGGAGAWRGGAGVSSKLALMGHFS